MSMNNPQATIETNVEGIRDAVVKAGFRPGRRVRVQVEYVDAKEVREAEVARLTAILDQYPTDPQFAGMSEEEVMAYAIQAVDEVRQDHRKSGK
jgi:methylphosphotriester-DNA--protein-cysteine methyltransferase